ncbi:hypothetical protein GAY31_18830 [Azospirillum brasilense]|nr:hypothetical protein [Azospirillum brasilense]
MDEKRELLPPGWAWAKLGDLGRWYGGGTPSKENPAYWTNGTIPWVSPKDMKTTRIITAEDHITPEAVAGSSTNMVPADAILVVTRSGILRHTLPVALTLRGVSINQDLKACVPHEGINATYVAAAMRAFSSNILHECVKDGTTVQSVEFDKLMNFEVPIAPPNCHQQIVDKIDELLSRAEEGDRWLRKVQAQLKKYRQAVLKAAVTGELTRDWRQRHGGAGETGADLLKRILDTRRTAWEGNEQAKATANGKVLRGPNWKKKYREPEEHNSENLPELPEGWVWASLDQLSWGSSYGTSQKCDENIAGVPVLRIPNVRRGVVNFIDDMKHCSVIDVNEIDAIKSGDMLIVRTNGSKALIGIGAVTVGIPAKPTYYASYLIRFRLVPIQSIWKYINMYWQSFVVRAWMKDHAATSAGQYNISQSKLLRVPIAIPGHEEMLAAIDRVEEEMSKIDAMEAVVAAELKRSARLRQSILKAAFSGKLVPQNPTDEPANVLLARLRDERAAAPSSRRGGRQAASLVANPVDASIPRRRGRPPKPKTEPESPQPAHRRGRPRKTELLA